jgi:hypothetical protein
MPLSGRLQSHQPVFASAGKMLKPSEPAEGKMAPPKLDGERMK